MKLRHLVLAVVLAVAFLLGLLWPYAWVRAGASTPGVSTSHSKGCSVAHSKNANYYIDWFVRNDRKPQAVITAARTNDANARYGHTAVQDELRGTHVSPGQSAEALSTYKIHSTTARLFFTVRWDDGLTRHYTLNAARVPRCPTNG